MLVISPPPRPLPWPLPALQEARHAARQPRQPTYHMCVMLSRTLAKICNARDTDKTVLPILCLSLQTHIPLASHVQRCGCAGTMQ